MALKWTGKSKGALANSANDQSKFSLQRLGQAIGLCSVLGTTALLSPAALALKTDFGMEYRATAFANQTDAFDDGSQGASDSDTGFANLIRVKGNFLDEDTGISVYTSVELAGDRWTGDVHNNTSNANAFNTGSQGDNVRLDLGYVQIPVGHTVFRIGRQASSFNNCFLVCDDRRDRILMIQPLSKTMTIIAGYDRRADTMTYQNTDNGDMALLGAIGKVSAWDIGLLYVHWANNYDGPAAGAPTGTYALPNVDLLDGYVSGDLGVVKTTVGFNYFTNGNYDVGNGQVFADDAPSAYVRLTGNAGPLGLGLQWVGVRDGGLVSGGFDTWSSLINNNPDATQSASSMFSMGGTGQKDLDQDLVIGKASFNVTPKFSVTGAVGQLSLDNGAQSDDSLVYDLSFAYQVNKGVKTWLSLGLLEKNDAGTLTGNGLTGQKGVSFADDDVKAASLNLSVDI